MSTSRDTSDQANMVLDIDLNSTFGTDVPESVELREAIGQKALDLIKTRTSKSIGWKGDKFEKYSEKYMSTPEFKAAKKSAKVDLNLTGDMLELMDIIDTSKSKITIGWSDSEESEKAHGHVTGEGNNPVRDFFNLNPKELAQLKSTFKDDIASLKDEQSPFSSPDSGLVFLRDLFEELNGDS